MSLTDAALNSFAREVRRLRDQTELTLYQAYQALIRQSYSAQGTVHVDSNRHTSGTGFPDLTVLKGATCLNWIEIKGPRVDVDNLPASDRARFDNYRRTLPHVVLTNGYKWVLYEGGIETGRVVVSENWLLADQSLSNANQNALLDFLRRLTALSPRIACSEDEAVRLLAAAANLIRSTVEQCDEESYPEPLQAARRSFTKLLQINPQKPRVMSRCDFADSLAQTTVFGFLLARIEAGKEVNPATAHAALNVHEHSFLKNALYGLQAPDPAMETLLKGPLQAACDMVNRSAPRLVSANGDWSRVTYVYENFFAAYRPADRLKYGCILYTNGGHPISGTRDLSGA